MTEKTLYLMRHAHSSDGAVVDHVRPLSPRGLQECRSLAEKLMGFRPQPECVLCSDAMRCRQTYMTLRTYYPLPEAHFESALYLASPGTLLRMIKKTEASVRSILLIGHNPGLYELAARLAGNTAIKLAGGLVTAGFAELSFTGIWGDIDNESLQLKQYLTP